MPVPTSRLAAFLAELKRRRVYRVTAVYAGIAFIITEVVANTFDNLMIPDTVDTVIYVLLALGFPIVIGLAWAFDITDKGIVRTKTKEEAAEAKATPHIMIGNKTLAIIAVLAVIVAAWALFRGPSVFQGSVVRIGVLPFRNLSGDSSLDYLEEGIAAEIIGQLISVHDLQVIGSTTMFTFKGSDKTLRTIGEELDLDVLLEGEYQSASGTIRIRAQLIDPPTEGHIWGDTYDREDDRSRILQIEAEIAQKIVEALRIELTPQEEERLTSAPQVNPETYQLYRRGWELRLLNTYESIPGAVEYLEQAVELDSTFARAWAALAICYGLISARAFGGWPVDSSRALMFEALDKALELDPNEVVALTWQGVIQTPNYNLANTSFRRALELEPGNVNARYEYGLFLWRTGQPSEALAELRQANKLDPFTPLLLRYTGMVYAYIRRYDKALEYYWLNDELQYGSRRAHPVDEFDILMQQGNYAEAAVFAEQQWGVTSQRYLEAEWAAGNREIVYAYRDSLRSSGELQQNEQENPWWSAQFYAIMDEKEPTLSMLEKRYHDYPINTTFMQGIVYSRIFDFLRAEPRFKALMREAGLTEVFDENGNLLRPLNETLEAYNAPGSR